MWQVVNYIRSLGPEARQIMKVSPVFHLLVPGISPPQCQGESNHRSDCRGLRLEFEPWRRSELVRRSWSVVSSPRSVAREPGFYLILECELRTTDY